MRQLGWGLSLLVLGLFEKVVLADGILAPVSDAVFGMKGGLGWSQGWLGMFAFTSQVFFDFSGYSLCAIGAAMCLGFAFPDNFRFPFAAVGFSDFWRRWHMSLSRWLRDYLYIPLGGSRKGKIRTYFAAMATMFIGGLWHGAGWQFIIWGGLQGFYLVLERILVQLFSPFALFKNKCAQMLLALTTFLGFSFSVVLFRSEGIHQAFSIYKSMFLGTKQESVLYSNPQAVAVVMITIGILAFHWLMRNLSYEELVLRMPLVVVFLGTNFYDSVHLINSRRK